MTAMRLIGEPGIEPPLWEVDPNLRPEGKDGALVRTLESHLQYYDRWAKSWEFQALLKARPLAGRRRARRPVRRGRGAQGVVELVARGLRRVRAAHARARHRAHPGRRGRRAAQARPGRLPRHRVHRPAAAARARRDGCRDPPARHAARARRPRRARLRRARGVGRVLARLPDPPRARAPAPARTAPTHPPHAARRRRTRVLARASGLGATPRSSPRVWQPTRRACAASTSGSSTGRCSRRSRRCPPTGSSSRASRPPRASRRSASATRAARSPISARSPPASPGARRSSGTSCPCSSRGSPTAPTPTTGCSRSAASATRSAPRTGTCACSATRRMPRSGSRACSRAPLRRRAARAHPRGGGVARGPRRAASAPARRAPRRDARGARPPRRARRRRQGVPRDAPPRGAPPRARGDARRLHHRGARPRAQRRGREPHRRRSCAPSAATTTASSSPSSAWAASAGASSASAPTPTSSTSTGPRAPIPDAARSRALKIVSELVRVSEDARCRSSSTPACAPRAATASSPARSTRTAPTTPRWSLTWEAQALLRARGVAGDRALIDDFTELADTVRYPREISEREVREVKRIKARVENERLPQGADPTRHLKLGRGRSPTWSGSCSSSSSSTRRRSPALRTTSTLDALPRRSQHGLIDAADAETLRAAWVFASRARSALTLWLDQTTDVLPVERHAARGRRPHHGVPAGLGDAARARLPAGHAARASGVRAGLLRRRTRAQPTTG